MTFREFLTQEEKGNPRPTPQRRVLPGTKIACKAAMPSRAVPDHDPIRFVLKRKRIGPDVALIPKPDNIVSGLIKRPSDQ